MARQDGSDHADGRGLAVRPDDMDRVKAPLRMAQRGHQPAHAVQAEAHPEQLAGEDVALGVLWIHIASCSARRRSSSSRTFCTTSGGAFSTNAEFASLRSRE